MSWFKIGVLALGVLILILIATWFIVKKEPQVSISNSPSVAIQPAKTIEPPKKQPMLQKPNIRVLSVSIEEKNRFAITKETMPKQINLVKLKQAKETPPIFLRCLFDPEGHFDLFVDPNIIIEPEKYNLLVHTTDKTQKLAFDFLSALEAGKSYELFFNREPFGVAGIRAFDYATELNANIKKEMASPTKLPQEVLIFPKEP